MATVVEEIGVPHIPYFPRFAAAEDPATSSCMTRTTATPLAARLQRTRARHGRQDAENRLLERSREGKGGQSITKWGAPYPAISY